MIGPPETIEEKERVQPFFIESSADPPVNQVSIRSQVDEVYQADFLSEDLGQDVQGLLFVNLDLEGERVIGLTRVQDGTIDGGGRPMSVSLNQSVGTAPGCYIVTLVITHADNVEFGNGFPKIVDETITNQLQWFVAHELEPHEITLADCERNPAPE